MRTLGLRVLAVSSLFCLAWLTGGSASCADLPAGTSESTVDGIRLRLYMPKLVYTLGEPVVVEVGLTNLAETPRLLAEPSTNFRTVRYDVRQVEGSGSMPKSTIVGCRAAGPSPKYGWEFKAGEERRCGDDLLRASGGPLPTGIYTVSATYSIDSPEPAIGAWHGTISTPAVRFSVVAPDASLADVSDAFVGVRSHAGANCFTSVWDDPTELGVSGASGEFLDNHSMPAQNGKWSSYRQAAQVYQWASGWPDAPVYSDSSADWATLASYTISRYVEDVGGWRYRLTRSMAGYPSAVVSPSGARH